MSLMNYTLFVRYSEFHIKDFYSSVFIIALSQSIIFR